MEGRPFSEEPVLARRGASERYPGFMRIAWLLCFVALLAGCSSNPTPPPQTQSGSGQNADTTAEIPPTAPDPLYEQIHSGLFQADAAVKKLGDALDLAKEMQKNAKGALAQAMPDIVNTIDDSGQALASLTGAEAPKPEDVAANKAKFETKRADLINQIGDILHDIRDQEDAAADQADNGDSDIRPIAKKLDELLLQIMDDLKGALTALGAKDPGEQTTPDTGDTNQKPPPGFDPNSAG